MKVTQNFKDKLERAKADGYKNVYSVVGAYMATDYCVFHDIDEVLRKPTGYDYGNQRPYTRAGMWSGHDNTRMVESHDIQFSAVHADY
jgi:hypothetical protein